MTVKLHHEIAINAPVDAVWTALADLQAVANYNPGLEGAKLVTTQKEGVGAARICEFRNGGGQCRETVTEWQPGKAMTIAMSDHAWPMKNAKFRMVLEPNGKGTMLKQVTEYVFAGDQAMEDAVRGQWDQGVTAVIDSFRRHVEKSV
jgi:uncharacterized protein YndB with AHSA1/START domain